MSKKADGEQRAGLYRREEHDACGVGFVAQLGRPASHQVVEQALQALGCLRHRGGVDADGASGDGAGVLIQLPTSFFIREGRRLDSHFNPEWKIAVGVFFLPQDGVARARAMFIAEEVVRGRGLYRVGWRQVPLDESALGPQARETEPAIWHLIVAQPANTRVCWPPRSSAGFIATSWIPGS